MANFEKINKDRLIAAAPAMLEVLKEIAEDAEFDRQPFLDPDEGILWI